MNPTSEKLMAWAIDKIKTEYPDDVALLVGVEGHMVNGDGHGEPFDYFVPATARGNELAQTFIIDGVGHDLYPRSWERTERTANFDDWATLCLANAKILYARSQADVERFEALRQKLVDNLADKAFMYRKALEELDVAMDLYRTMMFEDKPHQIRMAVGYIADYLLQGICYLNGTHEKDWTAGKIPQIQQLAACPDNFLAYYQAILAARSEVDLKNLAQLIISTTRQFMARYKPVDSTVPPTINYQNLAGWYEEMSLTWRRLYYYCQMQNSDAALVDACNLQNETNIIKEEFALAEMDLLGYFDADNLSLLSQKAQEWEEYIIAQIQSHGAVIRRYDTVEEFLAAQ